MFASRPLLVVRRTVMIRLLLCLIVLPFGLLALWGVVAASTNKPPDMVGAGICAVLAAAFIVPCVVVFRREQRRETRLHEEGIVQVVGSRTNELPWSSIREVWFEATRVQAGGLLGAAVGAAVHAARRTKGNRLDPNTTNITVRLVGEGKRKLSLTSNDKGVVRALEEVLSRVNPRLVADAQRLIQHGQPATFGPVSLSVRGVSFARKDPIAFSDIEEVGIKSGKLRLKKRGTWLHAFAIPLKRIPNVFAFMELYEELSMNHTGSAAVVDRNLARGVFV